MSPSRDDGDATRRRLLAATAEVIAELGWGAVTTRGVAERAGVTAGVVHYHFDSVDDLRRQAVMARLGAVFDQVLEAAGSLRPAELVRATLLATSELPTVDMLLLYESLPPTARDPVLRSELGGTLARYRAVLAERIRVCHPGAPHDPDRLAELLVATLDGLVLHHLTDPTLDVAAVVAPLLELLGPSDEEACP